MVKAITGNMILLGLSDVNMERLKQDQPIRFNLQELGLNLPKMDVVIFNGRTEESMQEDLKPYFGPDATIIKRGKK